MNRTEDSNILIHPRRGKKEKSIPDTGFLLVNPSEAEKTHTIYRQAGAESRYLFNSGLSIVKDNSSFIAGPSIGAPMAVMTMEKLIALGAKNIILFGWCGAISKTMCVGDLLLPDSAMSGEGTSPYYESNSVIEPSQRLNERLESFFKGQGVRFKRGCVWSTDAIYRENRKLLQQLRNEKNVSAVDMEFSALCSVAMFRGIQFSALLMVSDELWGESWRPGFSSKNFKAQCKHNLSLLLDFANNKQT